MASELWAVAHAAQVQQTIAQCRTNAAAVGAIAPDFPYTYQSVASGRLPGYWNGYLTWVLVQTLALARYPNIDYSLREAATVVGRFLDEPVPVAAARGSFALLRGRPRPLRARVPEIAAMLHLIATVGGAAAEARLAVLAPDADPSWSEEGALFFADDEIERVQQTLPAFRALLTDAEHGDRFHFWIVRQPGLPRAVREALRQPDRYLSDLEAIFGTAQRTGAQAFVLWAP